MHSDDDNTLGKLKKILLLGYVFESEKEIAPYLEDEETGPSVTWAKRTGKTKQNLKQG
jgi:hypothetical protein